MITKVAHCDSCGEKDPKEFYKEEKRKCKQCRRDERMEKYKEEVEDQENITYMKLAKKNKTLQDLHWPSTWTSEELLQAFSLYH